MSNVNSTLDFDSDSSLLRSESDDCIQYESGNVDSVLPMDSTLPEAQQPTISFQMEEAVFKSSEPQVEQAVLDCDLNDLTTYPHMQLPGINNPADSKGYKNTATGFEDTESLAYVPQFNANCGVHSEGQWARADNNSGPVYEGAGAYSGAKENYQADDYYFGMDNKYHQMLPPQLLQTGGNPLFVGASQYAPLSQQPSTYPAASYTSGTLLQGHILGLGAGASLEDLHPADAFQEHQQFQQPFPHTASAQAALPSATRNIASPKKQASRKSKSKSALGASGSTTGLSVSSNQPANPASQSNSTRAPHRLFTADDFLPAIRKGGLLLDDEKTWNRLTQRNHYDHFARFYGRPAVPNAVKGGPSDFKLRTAAIDALSDTDQQLLQDFINAAKYFAATGRPNRPSNGQAAINIESDDEEESEFDSSNQSGKYQVIKPKKRTCEQAEENSGGAPPQMRECAKSNPTVRLGSSQTKSQQPVKNPQGQVIFSDMDAANRWLASLGQPTILEAANRYLANQGIPNIHIPGKTGTNLSESRNSYVNNNHQTAFQGYEEQNSTAGIVDHDVCGDCDAGGSLTPSQATYNGHSTGVRSSRSSGLRPSTTGKRKVSANSDEQVDAAAAEMAAPRAKKARTENTGMVNAQSNAQTVPQRKQQANSRRRSAAQTEQESTETPSEAQYHHSPAVNQSNLGDIKTPSVDVGGRDASYDSVYQSLNSGLGVNGDSHSPYFPNTLGQFQFPTPIENGSLSNVGASSSNSAGRTSLENGHTYQLANEGLVGEGHENLGDFNFNFQDYELISQNNESAPQSHQGNAWFNAVFDFENIPSNPFQQDHSREDLSE